MNIRPEETHVTSHLMEGKASRSSGGSTASTGCNARNASTSSSWVNGQTHVWLSH